MFHYQGPYSLDRSLMRSQIEVKKFVDMTPDRIVNSSIELTVMKGEFNPLKTVVEF